MSSYEARASKNAKRGYSFGGQVLGTGANVEVTPKEGGGESAERVYDPFWANARELLDALDAGRMIHRNLNMAPIGSVILLSGRMSMVDLSLIKALWQLPSIRDLMIKGMNPLGDHSPQPVANRREQRARHKQPSPTQKPDLPPEIALMLEMLPVLPHSLNVILSGAGEEIWANLKEEHLIGSGSDLVLKHGVSIPGDWNMLGILDARPDAGGQADVQANSLINFDDPTRLLSHSLVGQMAGLMSPIFRMLLGRPGTHFGVTPLLIFRQVGQSRI